MKRILLIGFLIAVLPFQLFVGVKHAGSGEAKSSWHIEWEKTLAAANKEGQVTVYGRPGQHQRDVFVAFEEAYPQIKLNYLFGGRLNAHRIFAERRAGKYLVDIALIGAGSATILHKGKVADPIPPVLILPENKQPSLWFGKKHLYTDPQNRHVFVFLGNVSSHIGAYNTKLMDPKEIKSYWDLLNPKWKGKLVSYDPTSVGHSGNWKAIYYNPRLGPKFIRRLFSEMQVTLGRDQRQMLDWVARGRFHLVFPVNSRDVEAAKNQGLPVDFLEGLPEEGHLSSAAGHLLLVNKAPHPNAAKVMVNWLLSRKGQFEWQEKTGDNSLRTDIPKDMVYDPRSVPKEGVEYLITSLPQYRDVRPLFKVVRETLAEVRNK